MRASAPTVMEGQALPRPPGQRVAKRNARKEELVKYVLATRPKTHPRRGNPLSNLHRTPPRPSERHREPAGTLSRRPSHSNFARMCKVATKAVFSFGPCMARFLFHKMEKKMGGASPLDKPPAGADTPLAAVRRPLRTLHSRTASRTRSASEAPNSPIPPHFSIQYTNFIEYYTNRICFWSLTWKRSR